MTQLEFSEFIGATRGQIVSYESAESFPKGKVESEILTKFKISREQLYETRLNDISLNSRPVHPVTLEKRIDKLETQIELILKLLSKGMSKKIR